MDYGVVLHHQELRATNIIFKSAPGELHERVKQHV